MKKILSLTTVAFFTLSLHAQNETGLTPSNETGQTLANDTTDQFALEQTLGDVVVTQRRAGTRRLRGAVNGISMEREELFRAACCNLGESFTTNPSVDVSYDDATTGARQIRLLGLSGRYVQMLSDNLPDLRGSAQPFALSYVPGPWMKSIQVSKGASSVKNGYESVTGQINITLQPAEDVESITANVYGDSKSRAEANFLGNYHLTDRLSTALLAHYENRWGHHDENNDGFLDQPRLRQVNLHNRWAYKSPRYIFHGSISLLDEHRESGQSEHTALNTQHASDGTQADYYSHDLLPFYQPWKGTVNTQRYQATMKHAFVLNNERQENIALMASATMNERDDSYGYFNSYSVNEKNVYAQLMYESNLTPLHSLSTGLTYTHDYLGQHLQADQTRRWHDRENVIGMYAQYTFNLHERLVLMAGLRADHAEFEERGARYEVPTNRQTTTFVTPRFHLKWQPAEALTLRLSAGKGYRRPHALAEQSFLLARGGTTRFLNTEMEEAWNYGISTALYIPLFGQTLQVNAEYYYTHFLSKLIVDRENMRFPDDTYNDPTAIHTPEYNLSEVSVYSSRDRNYSHSLQVDATYPLFRGMTLTAAFRRNIVKETYASLTTNGHKAKPLQQPLVSRYKGLLTASYKTPLAIWQFDATLQLNGNGRLPATAGSFPTYEQLSFQVTRWFRHFSLYAGGENLTGYRQKDLIIAPDMPWSNLFDPTLVWGPAHGPMIYAGLRLNLERIR